MRHLMNIIGVGPWLSLRPPTSSTFRPHIPQTLNITALADCPVRYRTFGALRRDLEDPQTIGRDLLQLDELCE